ncbi:hypothetical protein CR513_61357, partial [Mucuna pruriens]
MILGQLALNTLWEIISTLYLCMKYPVGGGVGIFKADQCVALYSTHLKTLQELEVYADDMVQHCDKVFEVLKKHKFKLNSEKCSFGVQAGKFLDFILTRSGIEANLEKCEVVNNMRSPMSIKEVQQLAERVMALAHFLSRSSKKALLWTDKCETTSQELKAMLVSPPILTKSIKYMLILQNPPRSRDMISEDRKDDLNLSNHS